MKIIFDEKDENLINAINEDISKGELPPLFINEFNKKYYLEFECVDIAKANLFIHKMLGCDKDNVPEDLGIKPNAINYRGLGDLTDVKETLRNLLAKLEDM